MGRIHLSEYEEERKEIKIAKTVSINALKVVRKTFPNEVTQREIYQLKNVLRFCTNEDERIDFAWPTIERAKTVEQLEQVIPAFPPSFWVETFYGLEDTAEDRNLGKNIIHAMAQQGFSHGMIQQGRISGSSLVDFYKKLLTGSCEHSLRGKYPQSLVEDPEMASEMLKALNGILEKEYNEGVFESDHIAEIRHLLSDYDIWDNVIAKKGNKLPLKSNYANLCQTMQNIEIFKLESRHSEDKRTMDTIFRQVENSQIDNSIKRE